MKYKAIISNNANVLIKRHLAFIGKVSKEAARKQSQIFKDAIKSIQNNPLIYPFFEGVYIPYNKYRKYVISKRYIVIYQVVEDVVYIDYVIDTRSDYSWLK